MSELQYVLITNQNLPTGNVRYLPPPDLTPDLPTFLGTSNESKLSNTHLLPTLWLSWTVGECIRNRKNKVATNPISSSEVNHFVILSFSSVSSSCKVEHVNSGHLKWFEMSTFGDYRGWPFSGSMSTFGEGLPMASVVSAWISDAMAALQNRQRPKLFIYVKLTCTSLALHLTSGSKWWNQKNASWVLLYFCVLSHVYIVDMHFLIWQTTRSQSLNCVGSKRPTAIVAIHLCKGSLGWFNQSYANNWIICTLLARGDFAKAVIMCFWWSIPVTWKRKTYILPAEKKKHLPAKWSSKDASQGEVTHSNDAVLHQFLVHVHLSLI